jgi:enolase-phosphatase E1
VTAGAPSAGALGGVVLDIEGTTTPVSFVYDVLFPYARERLRAYVHEQRASFAEAERLLRAEWEEDRARGDGVPPWPERGHDARDGLAAYLEWLMERDRKSRGLKLAQGEIWERGYADGTLRGEVYPDVPPALERWRGAGLDVAIYSSGSVLGQRLLFANSTAGDLTPLICHYFDTSVGAKRQRDSYARIAGALGRTAPELLFISDVEAELEAARDAGFRTALCIRGVEARHSAFPIVRDFAGIGP